VEYATEVKSAPLAINYAFDEVHYISISSEGRLNVYYENINIFISK
jgi:hypothetical protein